MPGRCFIGVDVGTGSARAGVFDASGELLGAARQPIATWHEVGEIVEQSSDDIWRAVGLAVRGAVAESGVPPAVVAGLGFDATCSLVVVDRQGRPLAVGPSEDPARNVIVWMDHRALDQARRIHAIPMKKTDQALVGYLARGELQALLDAPDASTVSGLRDRAMLHLAFAAGMCVSELVGLQLSQIDRQGASTVHSIGKGRRERVLPLWKETAAAVKAWLEVRPASAALELFLNARGQAMTRSGFEYILAKHVATASRAAPSIAAKRVSPHVLRHTCAMHTLQATRDVRKVSLWLGHASLQSTEVYLRADPTEQVNLAEQRPEIVSELKGRLDAWVAKRLAETGRTEDPVAVQGRCGTRIGTPIEGETPGAGATPLHLRKMKEAANIPAPEELNAAAPTDTAEASTNVTPDENTGVPLHGYVDKPAD